MFIVTYPEPVGLIFFIFPVPLGSISELPADSCAEIKTSEGEQAVSGNYWLDPLRSGTSILAHCDFQLGRASGLFITKIEIADER